MIKESVRKSKIQKDKKRSFSYDLLPGPYKTLKELVEISSQSKNIEGVQKAQNFCSDILEKLGFRIEHIINPTNKSAKLLVATRKGQSSETIFFIGHTDTVGNPESYPFSLDLGNNKILGAGIADDKAGLVSCFTALESFISKTCHHHHNIRVIISPNEEVGSPGFHRIFKNLGYVSDIVLGLEPADISGNIISSRSGNRWYKLRINGRSAHSGRFGESHINASHELANIITKLSRYNNEFKKIRVNVGSIQTQFKTFNTICGQSEAKIDVRFSSLEDREFIHRKFLNILNTPDQECPYTGDTVKSFYSIEDDCPPLSNTSRNEHLLESIKESIRLIEGKKIESIHSGGAADINYLMNEFNIGVDGLGPSGGKLHTTNEYIWADSLINRAKVIHHTLNALEKNYENGL